MTYALGAVTASEISVSRYLLGQAMVTTTQLTAHYVNEYADVEADRGVANRTWFSGGSGVLVDGSLPVGVALRAAVATSLLAAASAAGLAVVAGATPAVIGLAALAVSWLYSMPPVRLLSTGWGELTTSVVVVVLVPIVGVTSQGGAIGIELMWCSAVLLPIHMAMMLAFELPDLDSDAAAGKRALGVRLGRRASMRWVTSMMTTAGVVLAAGGMGQILPPGTLWAWCGGLPAAVLVGAMRSGRHGVTTAAGVATLAVTCVGLTVGLGS